MQFKVFVLAEGVFQVPLRTFVLALVLGRGLRYFAEGIFAVRYGQRALAVSGRPRRVIFICGCDCVFCCCFTWPSELVLQTLRPAQRMIPSGI